MVDPKQEDFFAELIEKRGITTNWNSAGFILPDGRLLDLSNPEICADINVRAYTHKDMLKFFNYSLVDIINNGGIRLGICDVNNIPYIQISPWKYQPTSEQWSTINELFDIEPHIIDFEITQVVREDMKGDPENDFYKRYTIEDGIESMKSDMIAYINGDKSNIGVYNEKIGAADSI